MVVKVFVSGGGNKTLDKVYHEMINSYKTKDLYNILYNNFIKEILGDKKINDLTSNDIDYFYIYLKNKTYNGHFYSENYINKILSRYNFKDEIIKEQVNKFKDILNKYIKG